MYSKSQVADQEAFLQSRSKLLSIRRCRKRLDEIDAARRQLVLQIEELDAQAKVVQLEYAALAPISSLPDEILAMIFEAGAFERPRVVDTHFALLVSHVARHWRRIALGTPRLWSTIMCVNPSVAGDPKVSPEKRREQVAAFLSRSQSLSVDIYLEHFVEEDFSEDFIQLIGAYMEQCRRLCITGAHPKGLSRAMQHLSTKSAPRLHSINLYSSHPRNLLELQEPFFPLAPHLTVVQLDGFGMSAMHFCLPALRSVTSLELNNISIRNSLKWNAFRDALMALPLLDHLELGISSYTQKPRSPIVLPTVRFLHLDARPTYLLSIIHSIQAKSLVTLSLEGWELDDGSIDETDVEPELHFPSLRNLTLVGVTRQRLVLDVFARKFPDIAVLALYSAEDALCDIEYIRSVICKARGVSDTEDDEDIPIAGNVCARWSEFEGTTVSPNPRPTHRLFYYYYEPHT